MAERKRRALLGRIAEVGWFIRQGEPAATQSLAMLLEDHPVLEALFRHVEGVTKTDLSTVKFVVPEVVHEDGGRPDLEGHDDEGRPVLAVEAKFGALLEPTQVRSYLSDQAMRLAGERPAAFVLLVPHARVPKPRILRSALDAQQRGGQMSGSVAPRL